MRAIGLRALTAGIVNATIGAGIFVLPAQVASEMGRGAPFAYGLCALVMLLVVSCFAIAGSRVSLTGGLYAYIEDAFGPFVGYLGGVLLLLTCALGSAGVAVALASTVSVTWPVLQGAAARAGFLALVYGGLAAVNVRGVRQGASTVELLTVVKLLPLAVFVGAGLFAVHPASVPLPEVPSADAVGRAALTLVFAFVGAEVALVPSGEFQRPSRTVPLALVIALATTTLFYLAIQFVAQGVLGDALASFPASPLAEAASRFLGHPGAAMILAGGGISMFGYLSGDMLAVPRALFAFGRDGILPRAFASVHPRFRTPAFAICAYAVLVATMASIGSFGRLVLLANVGSLSLYLLTCLAALRIAWRPAGPDTPHFPAERVVPVIAAVAVGWLLLHATPEEFAAEAVVLGVATVLYWLRGIVRRTRPPVQGTPASEPPARVA